MSRPPMSSINQGWRLKGKHRLHIPAEMILPGYDRFSRQHCLGVNGVDQQVDQFFFGFDERSNLDRLCELLNIIVGSGASRKAFNNFVR